MPRQMSLKARRQLARRRKARAKTFNLKWTNDTIDQIVTELSEYSEREPEIAAALETMLAAKRLIQAYSQRMFDTPYRSYKLTDDEATWSLVNLLMGRLNTAYPIVVEAKNHIQLALEEAEEWATEGSIEEEAEDAIIDVAEVFNTLVRTFGDSLEDLRTERDALPVGKAFRSRYEGFSDNYGFDSPSSIFQQQVDEKREAELEAEYERIEAETEASTGLCRDDEGQFTDC